MEKQDCYIFSIIHNPFADYNIIYEIQNQIHSNSLANYENGIVGIGVGIDYLIQNNF